MRLVFLLRSLVLSGGIERVITDKANWLSGQGHDVLLLTYEQCGHPLYFPLASSVRHEDLDVRYFTVYGKRKVTRPFWMMLMNSRFRKRLREKIAVCRPDAIILPNNLAEFQTVAIAMRRFAPVVYESHKTYGELLRNDAGLLVRMVQRLRLRRVKDCRLVVSLTEGDAVCWRRFCCNVTVVPNPVTLYPGAIVRHDAKRLICVGRLTAQKRFDRAISAFAMIASRHPQWTMDVYGDGELRGQLQRQIDVARLTDRVRLLPPTADIYSEYQRSSFLVLSSDAESFGLVIAEAMACGTPVVSVRCPYGPSEIIDDGQTGLLSAMDAADLAAKMEWMMLHEAERQQMGRRARAAAARYSKENVMRQWEAIYRSAAAPREQSDEQLQ